MKRLLSILAAVLGIAGTVPAMAADLPAKTPVKIAPAVTASANPLYFFIQGGGAFSSTQSDITLPGVATGSPKVWPAGIIAGGGVGYLSSIGPFSVGVEAEGAYDFSHASIGCTGVLPCMGSSKNSWFFAEKGLAGITLSQIGGYIPGGAQPANWPVPLTVPASVWQNVMLLGVVGMAQRNVDLCATDLASGSNLCGQQWKNGALFGVQARFAISPNTSLRIEYDYIDFGHGSTFTPTQSIPLFANTVAAKDQQMLRAGINISLPPLF